MRQEQLKTCLVVGINGQFGRILARKLAAQGLQIAGLDLQERAADSAVCRHYYSGAIDSTHSGPLREAIRSADCVILCIPEEVIVRSLGSLCTAMDPNAVLVDIASVKSRICDTFQGISRKIGFLSIHPMFGPIDDFSGKTICIVDLYDNDRARVFDGYIRAWGATVTVMSASKHDAATALVQTLPHAALLAFGTTLQSSDIPFHTVWNIATPIQKLMLALMTRIVDEGHNTYWSIQLNNPYSAQTRQALSDHLAALSSIVDANQFERFLETMDSLNAYVQSVKPHLLAIASDSVSLAKE
jgi:prephenate dehydrogenase